MFGIGSLYCCDLAFSAQFQVKLLHEKVTCSYSPRLEAQAKLLSAASTCRDSRAEAKDAQPAAFDSTYQIENYLYQ